MKKEAKILQLKPDRRYKIEQQNNQIDILSIYYHELLKIDELIPENMKLKKLETFKV